MKNFKFIVAVMFGLVIFSAGQVNRASAQDVWVAKDREVQCYVMTEIFNKFYEGYGFEVVIKFFDGKYSSTWLYQFGGRSLEDRNNWSYSAREVQIYGKKGYGYTGRTVNRDYVSNNYVMRRVLDYCLDNLY